MDDTTRARVTSKENGVFSTTNYTGKAVDTETGNKAKGKGDTRTEAEINAAAELAEKNAKTRAKAEEKAEKNEEEEAKDRASEVNKGW